MTAAYEAAGATDVGRMRAGNEDALRLDLERGIFLVADGMGGHAAGEIASALAAEVVGDVAARAIDEGAPPGDIPEVLHTAVRKAHAAIVACCENRPATRGMGTTLTACVLSRADGSGIAHVAHVGDSRLYRLSGEGLRQLTRDQTWVQREVDAGRLAPADAAAHPLSHILTGVLTDTTIPEVELLSVPTAPGDLLLLASDGLYNMLPDAEIGRILRLDLPLPERVDALIDAANRAGGVDNITALVVRLLP